MRTGTILEREAIAALDELKRAAMGEGGGGFLLQYPIDIRVRAQRGHRRRGYVYRTRHHSRSKSAPIRSSLQMTAWAGSNALFAAR